MSRLSTDNPMTPMNAIKIISFGVHDVLRLVQRPDPRAGSVEGATHVSYVHAMVESNRNLGKMVLSRGVA